MNLYVIVGLAAAAIVLLGGLLIHKYGEARFDAGELACSVSHRDAAAATTEEDRRSREEVERETESMDYNTTVDSLHGLGILRADQDR